MYHIIRYFQPDLRLQTEYHIHFQTTNILSALVQTC